MKVLLIDNYDSFTFNLYHYISSLNVKVDVVRNNKITVRPIAGTRPRGKTKQEDLFYERDLIKDKKELSEHLMLSLIHI